MTVEEFARVVMSHCQRGGNSPSSLLARNNSPSSSDTISSAKMNVEEEDATCLLCTVELMVEILKRRKKFKFKKKRAKKKKFNQFDWDNFFRHDELHISRTLRMKKKSFFKLVRILTPFIKKKGRFIILGYC